MNGKRKPQVREHLRLAYPNPARTGQGLAVILLRQSPVSSGWLLFFAAISCRRAKGGGSMIQR